MRISFFNLNLAIFSITLACGTSQAIGRVGNNRIFDPTDRLVVSVPLDFPAITDWEDHSVQLRSLESIFSANGRISNPEVRVYSFRDRYQSQMSKSLVEIEAYFLAAGEMKYETLHLANSRLLLIGYSKTAVVGIFVNSEGRGIVAVGTYDHTADKAIREMLEGVTLQ